MKEHTCCFTGHRNIHRNDIEIIKKSLIKTVISLIDSGVIYFGAGGALGFDTVAAQTVLELRTVYRHIKLIPVLPCADQTKGWNNKNTEIYDQIKSQSDKIVYISKKYTETCLFERNRHLVNSSSYCVCYLKQLSGGTAYTVRYAARKGLKIINIADQISSNDKI